ncbi:MAG: M28 family peptidase [Candidatus Latescibacteria bacterium]|nr:M28 family peptidase [Candidatus Latescibacterota bacterium]
MVPLTTDLISSVDEINLRDWVFHIAKDPIPCRTMNYTQPGAAIPTLYEADDFLAGQLSRWGYVTEREPCQVQPFRRDENKPIHHQYSAPHQDDPWYTAYNLYATRTGSELPNDVIILISHKDSQSWITCAPGAMDNGVGTVANLELARVLSQYDPRRTIWHVWCNEEHTPWSSEMTAKRVVESGLNLHAAINIDSFGGKDDSKRDRMVNVTGYITAEGERIADLQAELNERFDIGLEQTKFRREFANDDDGSFIKAGLPAAAVMVGSFPYDDPNYHLLSDVPEAIDFSNVRLSTQLALATVLELDAE